MLLAITEHTYRRIDRRHDRHWHASASNDAPGDDLDSFEARQLALDGFTSSGSGRTPDERVSPLAPAFSLNSFHTREVR
jgi:hypothetical protein